MEPREEIGKYLETHNVLVLATVDEGGPWATPLFYASDENLDLYFLSDPSVRHCRAIAKTPRISAVIHGGSAAWDELAGLQIDGWAHAADGELEDWARACYEAKFPFSLALVPSDRPHRFYRIRPRWLRLIDNTRGLGFKQELCLDDDGRH